MTANRALRAHVLFTVALLTAACGDGPSELVDQATVEVVFSDLRPLTAMDGSLEVWVTSATDTVSVGRVVFPGGVTEPGEVVHTFTLPFPEPLSIFVTVEAPGDTNQRPSSFVMMEGDFGRSGAELGIEGVVTDGRPLEDQPGAHSLFTTSNNIEFGYPSLEDAGLWLFSLRPGLNKHGTREVKVTPLRGTWIYEGWAVYHFGRPDEVWVSYGKFRPDFTGLLTSRDDTGSGPFSGDEDYLNAGVEDVPGEEWTTDEVATEIGVSLPPGVTVPFDLDAVDPENGPEWTHVITIEPAFDEGEPMFGGHPFVMRPYRNPIGAGRPECLDIAPVACPGDPRVIEYVETPPTAVVRVVNR